MFDRLLGRLFARRRDSGAPRDLYVAVVARAREPVFYRDLGVPDTLDGRFDMIALHVFLVMHRLKGQGPEAETLARHLLELMVDGMDEALREMGVGDMGIGRRVKAMVNGVNGRLQAYDAALGAPEPGALEVALDNNVYGTVRDVPPAHLAALADYIRREAAALAARPLDELLAGRVAFLPVDHSD